IYPSDDTGNTFNWLTTPAKVNLPGPTPPAGAYDIAWIYGDWLASLPRVIAKLPALTSTVCSDPRGTAANCVSTFGGTLIKNAGASYSCARCHTTGWTSDAQIQNGTNGQLLKEPEKSFPGITWPRTADATFGLVNLSGGVTGDANKYGSWDAWGI